MTQERNGTASQSSKEAAAITNKQIDEIFLSCPDKEMYQEVLKVVIEATGSKHGAFGCMEPDGSVVVPALSKEVWIACRIPFTPHRFPRDSWTGIWIPALEGKVAHYSNESKKVPLGHIPINRVLIVPILYQDAVIGHFEVANKATDYSDDALDLLKSLADHIAPLLHARQQEERAEQ
jgi:GAF domain-containing protein